MSESPTLTLAATMRGEILGTAAYMSPEQASGKAVDKRTNAWAFEGLQLEQDGVIGVGIAKQLQKLGLDEFCLIGQRELTVEPKRGSGRRAGRGSAPAAAAPSARAAPRAAPWIPRLSC